MCQIQAKSLQIATCEKFFLLLAKDDERDILRCLGQLTARFYELGGSLGLSENTLDSIKQNKTSDDDALRKVIREWLKLNYNHDRYGLPSYKTLVDAVEDNFGGKDAALAMKIAKAHPAS